MDFPLKGGGVWTLYAEDAAEWRKLLPGLDIEREAAIARAWVYTNSRRRKTDGRRFLLNWLKRAWRDLPEHEARL